MSLLNVSALARNRKPVFVLGVLVDSQAVTLYAANSVTFTVQSTGYLCASS